MHHISQHISRHALNVFLKRADEDEVEDECAASFDDSRFGLRIGGIFIILVTSILGTVLPIILRKSSHVPRAFFDFAKYFGSGVIIATAFMHLLTPAFEELDSPCLPDSWHTYDWAPAIALMSVFAMFFAEVAAYRLGTAKLMRIGVNYSSHVDDATDAHGHSHRHDPPLNVDTSARSHPGHVHPSAIDGHETDVEAAVPKEKNFSDTSSIEQPSQAELIAQLVAVAVLEFGVILHSIIIGLTLAVSDEFVVLFIVIIFHQMFEGLGLGSRLASLHLPRKTGWVRYAGALLYSICTPVGMAVGLGVRESYNGNGAAMMGASGILDAISAGILLYTGLVELLAHEILLNPRMMKSSTWQLTYVFICMCLGAGLMALLAKWA